MAKQDPFTTLYGQELAGGVTSARKEARETGYVPAAMPVSESRKHTGATTVHHTDDDAFMARRMRIIGRSNNEPLSKPEKPDGKPKTDNRSYTTNNYSTTNVDRSTTTNTTAGQDHSAAIDDLKDRVDRLYRAEEDGYMAGQQAGRSARIEMPGTVLPNASTEHPSVSDNEPQQIQNNPNVNGLQFGNVGQREPYRM